MDQRDIIDRLKEILVSIHLNPEYDIKSELEKLVAIISEDYHKLLRGIMKFEEGMYRNPSNQPEKLRNRLVELKKELNLNGSELWQVVASCGELWEYLASYLASYVLEEVLTEDKRLKKKNFELMITISSLTKKLKELSDKNEEK